MATELSHLLLHESGGVGATEAVWPGGKGWVRPGGGPGVQDVPGAARSQAFRADSTGDRDKEHGLQERDPTLSPAHCVTLGKWLDLFEPQLLNC